MAAGNEVEISEPDTVEHERRATGRQWAALILLALPCLLVSFDAQALNLAVPRLTADLRPSATQLLWIVDIYVFLGAGSLITMGVLGDRVGRRRLLFIGATVFAAASLCAAYSPTPGALIAARAAMGVSGSALMPSTLSLIRVMFTDRRQRTVAMSAWAASFSLGGLLAPIIAGTLIEHFWWGSVFLVALPVAALLLLLGPFLLPRYQTVGTARLDIVSAVTSLAAVLLAVYGLKRVAQSGWHPLPVVAIVAGILLGIAFVRRQQHRDDPMVDLTMFRRPAFSMALTSNTLSFFVLYGTQLWIAQYLQLVLGLSPLRAGVYTIPAVLGYLAGSAIAPVAARILPSHRVIGVGLMVMCVGFALLTGVAGGQGLALLIIGSVVFSIGLAPVYALTTELIVASVPPERAGTASAITETGSELGGALGIALLGSLGVAIYRHVMAGAQLPRPAAGEVGGTIGSAAALARRLPAQSGRRLLAAATHAFTDAFAVMAGVSALIVAIVGVVALIALRHTRSSEPDTARSHHPAE
ncbi:MAG TPA: MFS transporter [Micromonosporaceae bacterium]